ncbi:MAG TPA: xanthine dehydrogenase family protein subunit M [Chloroflexota bacterium]|jgi:xanthine dehydrogenase YagS FAD-binding subunit|nr:xanthine dehydrogenase family protein subunit M [Chloroflexota bacterium]
MRTFEYTRPTTLDETVTLLQPGVRPLAGGTDLLPLLKADLTQPSHLLDIKHLPELSTGVTRSAGGLLLGALTPLSTVETHPEIRASHQALAEAAGLAATPQLRNMATLGGNLLQRPRCWYFRSALFNCWLKGGNTCQARDGENQLHAVFDASPCVAVHPSDPAAALLAFGARVRTNKRTVPLTEFFTAPTDDHRLETSLEPDELIVSVELPAMPAGGAWRSTYLKAMNRKVWAFALVGVAVAVQLDAERIAAARIVLNGVAPIPWRVPAAEAHLVGQTASLRLFAGAAEAAIADARPLGQNAYKLTLASGLLRQALTAVTA